MSERSQALRHAAAYAAYSAGWSSVRRLPEPAAYSLFDRLGSTAARRDGKGVRRLRANLVRVTGGKLSPVELEELLDRSMRSYLRYWCDVFRLPDWDEQRTVDTVDIPGEPLLREAMAAGKGMVVALPHMGNWDHVGAWASRVGIPVTTVAERLQPEKLFERFVDVRRGVGLEVLPLTGGEADLVSTLVDALRAGRAVCLLSDRDLRASGILVQLFGAQTRMPPGPALLSVLTGAPLFPVSTSYDLGADPTEPRPGRHRLRVRVDPAIPVPATGGTRAKVAAMTEQLAAAFETHIADAPQDWHMLQRLWDEPSLARGGSAP